MPTKEQKEEYEIVPLSPLRKLEKRIEQLEAVSPAVDVKEIFKEVVDVMRMNQQIVSELSKSNDALRLELSKLTIKLEDLVSKLTEFLSYLKVAAVEEGYEVESETTRNLMVKVGELLDSNKRLVQTTETMVSILEEIEKKLSKPIPPPLLLKKMPPKM